MKGVFGLKSPQDLFKKLESEYESLKANPSDAYVAYNFFATAWHLLEWKYPGKRGTSNAIAREKIRHGSTLLQLCEHLAVGAKHFDHLSPRHKSVSDTTQTGLGGIAGRRAHGQRVAGPNG